MRIFDIVKSKFTAISLSSLLALCMTSSLTCIGMAPTTVCAEESKSEDTEAEEMKTEKTKVEEAGTEETKPEETKSLRILATSDLHGKFLPWDYALNEESKSGSMAQLASAIAEYRNENTLLVDGGDTIQDNDADIFLADEGKHPMIQALNALKYDVCVTGNHEYNYGMDIVRKTISDLQCPVLTGNVYDESGDSIADGYKIFDMDGVRVAVIGMVTPNITRWDAVNLAKCTVTDPLMETRKIIDKIEGRYDVLVGVFHMGLNNEYGEPNSSVTEILKACPEFDVMISAHAHMQIPGEMIGDTLVVQNKNMAQTMAVIDLELVKDGDGFKVEKKTSESIEIGNYDSDPAIVKLLGKYDKQARKEAEKVIGELRKGALRPEDEIPGITESRIHDTALVDLINRVQLYYSGADVSSAAMPLSNTQINPGEIHKCDVSLIYKYTNFAEAYGNGYAWGHRRDPRDDRRVYPQIETWRDKTRV